MAIQTSYTKVRANLASLLDEVTLNRETVIITRQGGDAVAMVAASELSSLLESAYLLRSPKNAERLLAALNRALANEISPQSTEQVAQEVGFGEEA